MTDTMTVSPSTTADRVRGLIDLLRTRASDDPEVEFFVDENRHDTEFMAHFKRAKERAVYDGIIAVLMQYAA